MGLIISKTKDVIFTVVFNNLNSFHFSSVILTFTGAALTDKSHHERGALITFGGNREGLHNKLVRLGLWSREHQQCN